MTGYRFEKFVTDNWIWVTWEGEAILYDRMSGDTHRLRFPAGLVLDACLSQGQCSIEELTLSISSFDNTPLTTKDVFGSSIDTLCQLAILKSVSFEDIQPLSR